MRAVGKYTLLAKLGGGGMADVYLAAPTIVRAPKVEDLIALKMPRKDVGDDPEFVAMFLDEAKLAARLDHPNIVKTIEVGESDGTQFIAMEYLEGQPFSRIIPKIPDLSLEVHIEILLHVLAGIHYAHDLTDDAGNPLNVVHRDLTPQNVFVTYDGQVKILDFGIARAEGRSSKTRAGQIKGKVSYMSPEQARGRELDRRADLFAIGVMLFEACTGKRMWEGVKDVDVLTTLLGRRHNRSPQLIKPEVPDDLDAICHRALSVIEHRYQTAAELLRDLERYADSVERPSRETIAKTVRDAFQEKRATTRATIDAQLKKRASKAALRDSVPDAGGVDAKAEVKSEESAPAKPAAPAATKRSEPDMQALVANAFDHIDAIELRAHESDKAIDASPNGTASPRRPTAKAPTPPRPPAALMPIKDPVVASAESELPLVVPDEPSPPAPPPVRPPEPSKPKIDHVAALANSHVPTQTGRRRAASRPDETPREEEVPGLPAGLTPLKMAAWIIAVAVVAVLLTLVAQRLLQ
jgi:hypothetical protein